MYLSLLVMRKHISHTWEVATTAVLLPREVYFLFLFYFMRTVKLSSEENNLFSFHQ